jgi:hypothetical protein
MSRQAPSLLLGAKYQPVIFYLFVFKNKVLILPAFSQGLSLQKNFDVLKIGLISFIRFFCTLVF